MKARDALREADAAFQQTVLPPQVLARMRSRTLSSAKEPQRAWWWLTVPVLAATAALLFFLWPRAAVVNDVEDVHLAAAERFTQGRFALTAKTATVIRREHGALAIRSGEVEVSVAKHAERVRLGVSHGFIEIVGTRFTIRQREDGGDVTLHEGVIHFVSGEETRVLATGETYAWPPAPKPAPVADIPPPAPAPVPAPLEKLKPRVAPVAKQKEPAVIHETDAAWLLEEVDTCRSRGEFREAVRLLDKGLAGIVSAATRERFSFELGSILTWQLSDARACGHWAAHRAAFPNGRYERELERAMERATCEPR
jgi:transmembrane sensor